MSVIKQKEMKGQRPAIGLKKKRLERPAVGLDIISLKKVASVPGLRPSTLLLALLFAGCTTFKSKVATSALAGAAIGFAAAQQKSQHKELYSSYYAASGALIAAGIATLIIDPDSEIEKYKSETKRLREDLDQIQNPRLDYQSSGMMSSRVPDKFKNLVNPGEWRIYSIDQWIEDDENRLIHQDKIMELIPPSLVPRSTQAKDKK